jgi:LPXTG-motif cell wall-anchored protein
MLLALCAQTSVAGAQPNISVSPASASQGSTVTISGNVPVSGSPSCPAGDAVQLTSSADLFSPDGFGPQVTRDASGNFQMQFAIPAATPPGSYTVGMRCGGGNVGVTATLQVTPGAQTTTLPATGSSSIGPLITVGVAAVILGLVLLGRRPEPTDD